MGRDHHGCMAGKVGENLVATVSSGQAAGQVEAGRKEDKHCMTAHGLSMWIRTQGLAGSLQYKGKRHWYPLLAAYERVPCRGREARGSIVGVRAIHIKHR